MTAVLSALAKALGQLGDRRIVAVVIKSVGLTLVLFAGLGVGLYLGLAGLIESYGYDGEWAGLAAVVVVPVAMWFLFRVVAMAVLQFFADEVVAAVEARHYPALATQAQPLPFRRDLANSLRGLARALGYNLLALPVAGLVAFTGFGPAAVFLGVNAVLLGRELTDMAWLRHEAGAAEAAGSNPAGRAERFLLGLAVAGVMLVPGIGLLGPVVGAAAGTHLVLRRMDKETEA
jgi:uncharacterized protein involved in cysteine biosynthesis